MTPEDCDEVASLLNRNRELVDLLASAQGDTDAVRAARDEWYANHKRLVSECAGQRGLVYVGGRRCAAADVPCSRSGQSTADDIGRLP
jgi:hypothetical protein